MGLRELPRVDRLDLAVVQLPKGHPAAGTGGVGDRAVPVFGYVVHHPDGPIVVDTGVGHDSPLIDELYRPRRILVDDALAAHGVEVDDVVMVVNSHLHFDHCGQNPRFHAGDARFVVQRSEVAAVAADPTYTVPSWAIGPDRARSVVDGDEEIAEGVTVLATPGHTEGHQSVLVEGGGRRVVIGAQVVWHREEYDAEVAAAANVDPDDDLRRAAVASIRRLKALGPEVVHFSHCPAVLAR